MFPIEAFEDTLRKVVRVLETCGIGFHLTGGVTSIAHGEPRMTQDVDIVIDNARATERCAELLRSLRDAGFFFDDSDARASIANERLFKVLDREASLELDLYPRELIPGELSRSESLEVFEGLNLPVASLADAALSKLIWISKGSHKNRRDFRQLFARANPKQKRTITDYAVELALDRLMREVCAEPDEIV